MRSMLNGFKVMICAVLVHSLVHPPISRMPAEFRSEAEAAMPPGHDMPGFGGATAPPRMLIIMDTSKSMASTPDMTKTMPLQDFDGQADSVMSPPICGEDPNTIQFPGSGGLSSVVGIPNQSTGAMEGSTLNLACPVGETIVQIDWAAYGKRTYTVSGNATTAPVSNFPGSACTMPALAGNMRDTTALDSAGACNDALSTTQWVAGTSANRGWVDVTTNIANRCVGLTTCSVPVTNAGLGGGDPCSGTGSNGKYALASFRCSSDPCPPNSGSKFCIAKKALHRIVSDNASNTLEMSAGGYFQTQWEKYSPAQSATYNTKCAYDIIAKSSTVTNRGYLTLRGDEEFGPAPVPNTPAGSVTYACNPETYFNVSPDDPTAGVGPDPAYPGWCTAQPAPHTCTKRFTETVNSLKRYQHDDPLYRSVKPVGAAGSWSWGAGPQPLDRLTDVPKRYFSNASSAWDPRGMLTVRAADIGGTCVGGPPTIENVPSTLPPASSAYPGTCVAGNECTFFNTNMSQNRTVDQTSIYYNAGPAPQTVRGLVRTNVSAPVAQTGNLPLSYFGGSTCPDTPPPYTGPSWAPCGPGDDRCEITRVGSDVPNVSYSCPAGYWLDGVICRSWKWALNPNVVIAPYTQDVATDTWSRPMTYTLSLATVAAGQASCFDGQTDTWTAARFPLATTGLLSFVPLFCGANDTTWPGRCSIRGASPLSDFPGGPIRGVVNTDAQTVTCSIQRFWTFHKHEMPATPYNYCTYTRNRYDWSNDEQRCIYQRFLYDYSKHSFIYSWPYNNGDYAGYFMDSPAYLPTATVSDAYCTSAPVPGVNPSHTDTTGFTVPSGSMTCAAELAPGTSLCPADALRCKLRWNAAKNNRFTYFKPSPGADFRHPATGAVQPRIGCAVGDQDSQTSASPLNFSSYKNDHSREQGRPLTSARCCRRPTRR